MHDNGPAKGAQVTRPAGQETRRRDAYKALPIRGQPPRCVRLVRRPRATECVQCAGTRRRPGRAALCDTRAIEACSRGYARQPSYAAAGRDLKLVLRFRRRLPLHGGASVRPSSQLRPHERCEGRRTRTRGKFLSAEGKPEAAIDAQSQYAVPDWPFDKTKGQPNQHASDATRAAQTPHHQRRTRRREPARRWDLPGTRVKTSAGGRSP